MISDLTHPESPKMMTFKSTFFLEVILLQLEGDKEQVLRQGCISNAPLRHCIIKIHKPFHQILLHVCAGNWTNQLRGPHMRHVISKLLTESRGTHRSFFCAHTPQEVTSWRTHAFIANPQEPHILFLTVLLSTPRAEISAREHSQSLQLHQKYKFKGFFFYILVSSVHCFTEVTWMTKTRSKVIPKSWGRKTLSCLFQTGVI